MPKVRFKNGGRATVYCSHCRQQVGCTTYMRRIRWVGKLDCVHALKHLGYCQPIPELERKGLIAKKEVDPRIEKSKKEAHDRWREDIERRTYAMKRQS